MAAKRNVRQSLGLQSIIDTSSEEVVPVAKVEEKETPIKKPAEVVKPVREESVPRVAVQKPAAKKESKAKAEPKAKPIKPSLPEARTPVVTIQVKETYSNAHTCTFTDSTLARLKEDAKLNNVSVNRVVNTILEAHYFGDE